VEQALAALGQGFLAHSENAGLRESLHTGALTTEDYFNQLLRLVYRLIFLLTVEERNLLHSSETSDKARTLYAHLQHGLGFWAVPHAGGHGDGWSPSGRQRLQRPGQ